MFTVVFDAGPLIMACKFELSGKLLIDHLQSGVCVVIAPTVEEEVAISGARYPDGRAAGERIARGDIQVRPVETHVWTPHLAEYAMGKGEQESIELCGQLADADALITDDYLAFVASTRLGQRTWMLPDLIVEVAEVNLLAQSTAKALLEVIRPRYRPGVIAHSLARLQEDIHASGGHSSEGRDPADGGAAEGIRG